MTRAVPFALAALIVPTALLRAQGVEHDAYAWKGFGSGGPLP